MERGDEICAVVDRNLRSGFNSRLDVPVVGLAVFTLDGEHGDPRLYEVGGDVILGRKRVRCAQDHFGAAGLQRFGQVGRF